MKMCTFIQEVRYYYEVIDITSRSGFQLRYAFKFLIFKKIVFHIFLIQVTFLFFNEL